jgi:hypothetical protein
VHSEKLAKRALHPAGQLARLPQRKICRLTIPRLIGGRHYSVEILWRENHKIQIWLAGRRAKAPADRRAARSAGLHDCQGNPAESVPSQIASRSLQSHPLRNRGASLKFGNGNLFDMRINCFFCTWCSLVTLASTSGISQDNARVKPPKPSGLGQEL